MYKKAVCFLALLNMLVFAGVFCVTGIRINRIAATPAFQMRMDISCIADEKTSMIGMAALNASSQRVVKYELLEVEEAATEKDKEEASEDPMAYQLDEEEYDLLLRIVEAEAGSEDEDGRVMVANVVFNRVNSEQFPDTVSEVVLQQSHGVAQFSPVSSGRIWTVTVSDETVDAVQRALEGEDLSSGALYFAARRYADSESMRWFDEKLTFLFRHGGHEFFL